MKRDFEDCFEAGIENLQAGALAIRRGAAQIILERQGADQIEKGVTLLEEGVLLIKKALRCKRRSKETAQIRKFLRWVKRGIRGIHLGLMDISELWLKGLMEILRGLIEAERGYQSLVRIRLPL